MGRGARERPAAAGKFRVCALASEVEQNRLAKALWEARKRRGVEGRASSLAWELKRIAGRLLKLLRSLKRAGQ